MTEAQKEVEMLDEEVSRVEAEITTANGKGRELNAEMVRGSKFTKQMGLTIPQGRSQEAGRCDQADQEPQSTA